MTTELDAAKVIVEVTSGLVPGTPQPELTRRWAMTREEYDAPGGERVMQVYGVAWEYARSLWDPARTNWTRLDWLWL